MIDIFYLKKWMIEAVMRMAIKMDTFDSLTISFVPGGAMPAITDWGRYRCHALKNFDSVLFQHPFPGLPRLLYVNLFRTLGQIHSKFGTFRTNFDAIFRTN